LASGLEFLDQIGGAGVENAPAVLYERQAQGGAEMGLSAAGRDRDIMPGIRRLKGGSFIRFTLGMVSAFR
jgi:hypothetical protein